jgi:hypothetical protein
VSCCCEKLEAEAGIFREPRGRGTSVVGSRYRATASDDVTVETSVCLCVCVFLCVILNCEL